MLNKFKRQMAATIAAAMMLSTTAFANTAFTDVKPSDWYYSTVTKLADTGIINGTGDGSFNPTGEVGIDSFIKMLVTARKMEVGTGTTDYWAEPYLKSAEKAGFEDLMHKLYCYELSGNFRQSKTTKSITREQMAALIAKALELDGTVTNTTQFDTTAYTDFSSINKEYNTAVRSVIINGIMGGKGNGRFDAQGTVTRAEAAAVIARYMYPEERISYNYTAKEEKHNVGDIYTDYNTWIVPTEVKVYETGQAIPTVSQVSMVYVQELDKYLYAGMLVSELEEIMGCKATKDAKLKNSYYFYTDDGKVKMSYTQKNAYVVSFAVSRPHTVSFNGHSIGEKPMLLDEYIPRTEYEEYFTNGGAIDMYPHIEGIYEMNGIKIGYAYYTDGCTQAALDRWGIPSGTENDHLPTILSNIAIHGSTAINRTLGIE